MITEDYVSVETAKLLKEKGFNYPTETGYSEDGHTMERAYNIGERSIYGDAYNWNKDETHYSRPTLWEAMKWLRKEHRIFLNISYIPEHFAFTYRVIFPSGETKFVTYVDTYEQACEAAIKYCLEKLI